MCRGNKVLLVVTAFLFFVSISSVARALNNTYYSMGGVPMYTAANLFGNQNMYMAARAQGAYAFTDYASAWGLNNLAQTGAVLGLAGVGMGLGALNSLTTWGQSYPKAPMYGYSSALYNNPYMGYANYPLGYGNSTFSLPMQSYYPTNFYSQNYNTDMDFSYWWPSSEDEEE